MNRYNKPDYMDINLYAVMPRMKSKEIHIFDEADETLFTDKANKRVYKKINRSINYLKDHSEYRHGWQICKRLIAAILIISTLIFGGILCIASVREAIWEEITTWCNDYIQFEYTSEEIVEVSNEILEYKEPTVSEEFERYVAVKNANTYIVEYNTADVNISYQQSMLDNYETLLSNNDSNMSTIMINKMEINIFVSDLGVYKYYSIIWNDGRYAYSINSNLDIDNLLEIIKTIK